MFQTFYLRSVSHNRATVVILTSACLALLYLYLYSDLAKRQQKWIQNPENRPFAPPALDSEFSGPGDLKIPEGPPLSVENDLEEDLKIIKSLQEAIQTLKENISYESFHPEKIEQKGVVTKKSLSTSAQHPRDMAIMTTLSFKAIDRIRKVDLAAAAPLFGDPVQIISKEQRPNRSSFFAEQDEFQKNRTCKIPYIYPFEEDAMRMLAADVARVKVPYCLSKNGDKFTSDMKTKIIRNDPTGTFWKNNTCCYIPYIEIIEDGLNVKELTECIDIVDDITTVPSIFENIKVVCNDSMVRDNVTYRDHFHFLRLNATLEKDLDKKLSKNRDHSPNVIILGLDTVSLANFQRFLPKSREFVIKKLKGIEFSGVNKIGFGTMDNLIPMFSNCGWSPGGKTIFPGPDEECTQVWERFSAKGYRTVFSVEEYWVLMNQKMRRNDTGKHNMTYNNIPFAVGLQSTSPFPALKSYGCLEHKLGFEILSDRLLQVGRKLKGKPYFHLLWSIVQSHETTAMVQFLEKPLLDLLEKMQAEDLLNDTIFMLISDHGMCSSVYAGTFEGNIEANAPFLYFVFPPSFRKKYSRAVANVERNSKGLVTPHDIYQTLLSLLNLTSITNAELKRQPEVGPSKDQKGISLFRPIPLNRSCDDAHVPEQFCLCWSWTEVEDLKSNSEIKAAAIYTVKYINEHLQPYPSCLPLTFERIDSAKRTVDAFGNTYLSVAFYASPSRANLQALVTYKKKNEKTDFDFELVGNVERKNKYGDQSACLGSKMQQIGWIRTVCFCKDFQVSDSN